MSRIKDHNKKEKVLPIAGKVKVGMIKPGANYPMSLDYFRATGRFATKFHNILGDQPKSILIGFVSDDIANVCNERYQIRNAQGKNFAEGDGETFRVWSEKSFKYEEKICENEDQKQKLWNWAITKCSSPKFTAKWYQLLTIRFIIPSIPVVGLWELNTKGEASSIKSIVGTFDMVQSQAQSIIGVPFQLTVQIVKGDNPGKPKKYPVINITPVLDTTSVVALGDMENRLSSGSLRMLDAKTIKELAAPEPEQKALPPSKEVIEATVIKE